MKHCVSRHYRTLSLPVGAVWREPQKRTAIIRKKMVYCIYSQSGTTFHCHSHAMIADVGKEHAISESTYLKWNLCNALIPKIINIDNKRMVILSPFVCAMEDLLIVQTNHLSWTPQERDELIDCALRKFMSKRRKLKLETTSFNMIGVCDRKRTHRRANSSDSEDESNGDNEQADDQVNDDIGGNILQIDDFSGSDLSDSH